LKRQKLVYYAGQHSVVGSIHPQGWVPVETCWVVITVTLTTTRKVAFTPKGGCPLKPFASRHTAYCASASVAFTPKGGCPLKLGLIRFTCTPACSSGSIHPQGWVPVET